MEQQTLTGKIKQKRVIKSISYSQEEIIRDIMELYGIECFELDPTYSKGNFYKKIPKPKLKFDIEPQLPEVQKADCTQLPLENNSVKSIMFDPPFIASIPTGKPTGIINQRFGYYRNIQVELWNMYHKALEEFYRVLKEDGILVFKCQDTIDASKQYLSHVEIINYASLLGFYPKDLFVLLAENRIIGKTHHNQQHCRKYHSYFLVFIKQKNPVKYTLQLNSEVSIPPNLKRIGYP